MVHSLSPQLIEKWHISKPSIMDWGTRRSTHGSQQVADLFSSNKTVFPGWKCIDNSAHWLQLASRKFMKELGDWFKETKFGLWEANIQMEAPVLVGWLLFSTNNTNTDIFKWKISKFTDNIPVGLHWKMISLGTQGKIAKESQVCTLQVYINRSGMQEAKPCLMTLYADNSSIKHQFLLHIYMCLVLEIDLVSNTQGCSKIN